MDAKSFFQVLYPNFDKNKNKINTRLIHLKDRDKKPISRFFTEIDGLTNYLLKKDKLEDYQIYFSCPELKPDAKNSRESSIARYQFLYSDLDPVIKNKDQEIIKVYSKEELKEKIKHFPLPPSLVVSSGEGFHLYWLLNIPIYQVDKIRFLLNKIQEKIEGDPKAVLSTQLLRAPLTHNKKNEWKTVRVIDHNCKRYTLSEVYEALGITEKDMEKPCHKESPKRPSGERASHADGIFFDFKKKVEPLNKTIHNSYDLLDLIKKQNPLQFTNRSLESLGQAFKCCFHDDKNPSANIFLHQDGYYYYKCFGCNTTTDLIGIYQSKTGKRYRDSLIDLANIFGIKSQYTKWVQEQTEIYKNNLTTLLYWEQLGYDKMYPSLNKMLKGRKHYLNLINEFGLVNIRDEDYSFKNRNVFFLSYEHFFSQYRDMSRISLITTVRTLNLFCALGLIEKVPLGKLNKKIQLNAINHVNNKGVNTNKKNQVMHSNFYITKDLANQLQLADERAEVLFNNNFKISTMSKESLIISLGQEIADMVYPGERSISKTNSKIADALTDTLVKLINEQGYATKKQIVSKTRLASRYKANKTKKETELDKYLGHMLKDYNLEYIKPNKNLKSTYKLKDYSFIIVPKT